MGLLLEKKSIFGWTDLAIEAEKYWISSMPLWTSKSPDTWEKCVLQKKERSIWLLPAFMARVGPPTPVREFHKGFRLRFFFPILGARVSDSAWQKISAFLFMLLYQKTQFLFCLFHGENSVLIRAFDGSQGLHFNSGPLWPAQDFQYCVSALQLCHVCHLCRNSEMSSSFQLVENLTRF